MAIISAIGTYLPRMRLDRKAMYKAIGWVNPAAFKPGFKAIANWDEDSVTMAVAAARDLRDKAGKDAFSGLDALFFASATPPFQERPAAGIVAAALDLDEDLRTADFSDSPNAMAQALFAACDLVDARHGKVLVVTGDTRMGRPGAPTDYIYGDAGAAVLVQSRAEGLEVVAVHAQAKDFMDHWRGQGEQFDRAWEDRWIRDAAFTPFLVDGAKKLLEQAGIQAGGIAFAAIADLYARDLRRVARGVGLNEQAVTPPLSGEVGYTGNPQSLLLLSRAAAGIKPGDTGMAMGFGYGVAGMALRATQGFVPDRFVGVDQQIRQGEVVTNYTKYAGLSGKMAVDKGIRGEVQAFTALNLLFRRRREVLALVGTRCKKCGTPQYPPQRVCVNPECRAVDEMEPYSFAELEAKVFSFTEDHLAYTPNPPAIYALVDFDGGGRFWFDITDVQPGQVRIGTRVRFAFRVKYVDENRGLKGYFYKAIPVQGGKDA